MTTTQRKMYFGEWRTCWIAIIKASGGQTTQLEDDVRAAVTFKALGRHKSSRDFNNTEFDQVLATMWSLSHADDLNLQLRQINQPITRAEGSVYAQAMLDAIEIEPHGREAYLGSICQRIFKKGLATLKDSEWPIILAALNHTRLHKNGIAHNHPRSGHGPRSRFGHRVGSRSGVKPTSPERVAQAEMPVENENPF